MQIKIHPWWNNLLINLRSKYHLACVCLYLYSAGTYGSLLTPSCCGFLQVQWWRTGTSSAPKTWSALSSSLWRGQSLWHQQLCPSPSRCCRRSSHLPHTPRCRPFISHSLVIDYWSNLNKLPTNIFIKLCTRSTIRLIWFIWFYLKIITLFFWFIDFHGCSQYNFIHF